MVVLTIPGRIVAKQSVRFTKTGHRYQPGEIVNYHARCAHFGTMAMAGRAPITGPCRMSVQIVLAIPVSWSKKRKASHKWCVAYPDLDNSLKAIFDGLKGIVFTDDKQIVEVMASKRYGQADKVIVEVVALETQKPEAP